MSKPRRPEGDRVRQALESLSRAVEEQIARHPQGHLATARGTRLVLNLEVPAATADGVSPELVEQAKETLDKELEALLAHRAAFQPGRVLCLRCASVDCEHSQPTSSRQVFVGYGPTGIANFQDYGQWLLESQHPEMDRLYQRPPQLVTDLFSAADLESQLVPAFRERAIDYRIHGQVTAGWFPVPGKNGTPEVLALSMQVLSSAVKGARGKRGRRRFGLNVLGSGPSGEPLAELYERLGSVRWTGAVRWGQEAVESIERWQGGKTVTEERLRQRVEGLLAGIARRLEHHRRAADRRTGHAQKRHQEGDRPTRMALRDLARAADDQILRDTRRDTLVVLGEKGRAHVFNSTGKLVTSIRYSADSIENKRRKVWQPAPAEAVARLRAAVLS